MYQIPMIECREVLAKAKEAYQLLINHLDYKEPRQRRILKPRADNQLPVGLIAYARYLIWKEDQGAMCHQCKRPKMLSNQIICTQDSSHTRYCQDCLWNRYGVKVEIENRI